VAQASCTMIKLMTLITRYTFPVICYDADRLVCIVYAKVSFSTETVQRYNTIQYAVKRNEEEYTSEINFTQLHATNRLCIA